MSDTSSGAIPRAIAARAVDAVVAGGRNLDLALAEAGISSVGELDRALATALAYGTLRTHLRNQYLISVLANRPFKRRDSTVVALISVGLFALTESRRPDYAVVSATVSATAKLGKAPMKGVVNALLRRFLRERETLLADADKQLESRWMYPDWFITRVQSDWPEDWQDILDAGNRQAPLWLRINLSKTNRADWVERFDRPVQSTPDEVPSAVMLEEPMPVEAIPGFLDGLCSVQDVASQIAATLLDAQPGMRVLDACAAPGGKATHILENCPAIGELVALDQVPRRIERIADNLKRLSLTATLITGDVLAPDGWWDGKLFDRILLDAPCSATGVIRRHPDIRFLRNSDDIRKFASQQMQINQVQ